MMKIFKKSKKCKSLKKIKEKYFYQKISEFFFFPKILQKIILDQKHSSVDQKCGNFETIDFFLQNATNVVFKEILLPLNSHFILIKYLR